MGGRKWRKYRGSGRFGPERAFFWLFRLDRAIFPLYESDRVLRGPGANQACWPAESPPEFPSRPHSGAKDLPYIDRNLAAARMPWPSIHCVAPARMAGAKREVP